MTDERRRGTMAAGREALLLATLAALVVAVRVHSWGEPLDPDLSTYATIGQQLLDGARLYVDVWDAKPPGLYLAFAAADGLFGGPPGAVYALGLACSLATLALVFAVGRSIDRRAGLWAAAVFASLESCLPMQADLPNTEALMNVLCTAAFALMLRTSTTPVRRWASVAGAGLCFALASTIKPLPIFPAALIAAANVVVPPKGESRRRAALELGVVGAMGAAVWGLILAYAAAQGQLDLYVATNLRLNAGRSEGALFNLYRYVREIGVLPANLRFLVPLFVFAGLPALRGLWRLERPWWLLSAWALGVHAMIFVPGGPFHPHAYQLWLPVLAIGTGWAAAGPLGYRSIRIGGRERALGPAVATACLVWVAAHELPKLAWSPDAWARAKFGPNVVDDRDLGRSLRAALGPDETLFVFGNGAALYLYSGRRPTTPSLWARFLLDDSALRAELSERTLAALRAAPPDLYVLPPPSEWAPGVDTQGPPRRGRAAELLGAHPEPHAAVSWDQHPIQRWAMAHYRPWPASALPTPTRMRLYVRRGSALEARLSSAARPPTSRPRQLECCR